MYQNLIIHNTTIFVIVRVFLIDMISPSLSGINGFCQRLEHISLFLADKRCCSHILQQPHLHLYVVTFVLSVRANAAAHEVDKLDFESAAGVQAFTDRAAIFLFVFESHGQLAAPQRSNSTFAFYILLFLFFLGFSVANASFYYN